MNCGRCGSVLIRNHDELFCLHHDTQHDPVRAHDAIEEPGPRRDNPEAPRSGERWSERDIDFLIRTKDTMSSRQVALLLQRSERSVDHMRSKLGIRKARVRNIDTVLKHPPDVVGELEDGVRPGYLREHAQRLGLTYRAAYLRLYRRGIRVRTSDGSLSIAEVARLYRCTRRRVQTLIRRGVLVAERRSVLVVRIDPASVARAERYLRARSRHHPAGRGR